MEAAEILACQLQLPELISIVASYLNGSGPNGHESIAFKDSERILALALFPYTGNVRIVVYYSHLLVRVISASPEIREHLCLVNGLLHSFGSEPARILIHVCPTYPCYTLEWKTFGRNCLDYPCKMESLKIGDETRTLFNDAESGATYRTNAFFRARVIWARAGFQLECASMQSTPCERDCAICQDPKFKFLKRFGDITTQMVVARCRLFMDFKWIAQFCVPRESYATRC